MLFDNASAGLLAFAYASLTLCVITILCNIGLFIYLLMGRMNHQSMTRKLYLFPIVGAILSLASFWYFFVAEQPAEGQPFVSNLYLSLTIDICQLLLGAGTIYLCTEILRILHVLTKFWTPKKIDRIQWILLGLTFIALFVLIGYYATGCVWKTSEEMKGNYWQIAFYSVLFFDIVLPAVYDASQSLYFVRKLYNLLKEKQSHLYTQQSRLLSIQYRKVCGLIITCFTLDVTAITFGYFAIQAGVNQQLLYRSYCGIGYSQAAFRVIIFTRIFMNIRQLKIISTPKYPTLGNDISKLPTKVTSGQIVETPVLSVNTIPFEDMSMGDVLGFGESEMEKSFGHVGSQITDISIDS
ncbi:hypothetical protein BC833DRAFT_241095 [Globomyces pollinis-pini]|nr:hypothetical protein BC833DRAFT_241095 [Globomyces pollinis-pini]